MTFAEIIEKLRDGRPAMFTHPNLNGFFYKAAYPSRESDAMADGAHSAITFWSEDSKRASPVMLLDDFDRDDWTYLFWSQHPSTFISLKMADIMPPNRTELTVLGPEQAFPCLECTSPMDCGSWATCEKHGTSWPSPSKETP